MRLTRMQLVALKRAWQKSRSGYKSFLHFRRAVRSLLGYNNTAVVAWCGMWLCIETNGHTHS